MVRGSAVLTEAMFTVLDHAHKAWLKHTMADVGIERGMCVILVFPDAMFTLYRLLKYRQFPVSEG